jgi:5-methylcytosine-specific restriction endonuclease McrA
MPLMKICNGCGKMTTARRCPPCQQAYDRAHNRQRAAKAKAHGRNTAAWRKLRAAVLERDDHQCRSCGSGNYLTAHLDPALGGNHWNATPDDCVTLCASCHGQVDAPRATRRGESHGERD